MVEIMNGNHSIGIAIITGIVVSLIVVVVVAYAKRSKSSTAIYLGLLIGGTLLSLGGGALAAGAGAKFLEGYAAVMVLIGTVAQLLLDTSIRKDDNHRKLIDSSDHQDALKLTGWALIVSAAIAVAVQTIWGNLLPV